MKRFLLTCMLVPLWQALLAQCAVPVITAGGPTALCPGGNVTLNAPASNAWTQKADFGGVARQLATGFSIGSKGYIGTGSDITDSNKKDFWEYDPNTNAWTQKADFGGVARYAATGFSIGSKGYIGTGFDGNSYKKDFWEYNQTSNVWTQKADFGGTARYQAKGFSIGSKGYIGIGVDGSYKKDFWEYDPTSNAWTQKADFGGTARRSATGFSIGSKGYIGTGFDGSYKKDFWEYNPTSNAWIQKADFGGTARRSATGFSIGSKGYIGTGFDGTINYKKDFWEYDPATGAWTQKADFGGTARREAMGFSIGSKGYIGTGLDGNGSHKKDFWEFDPASNVWTQKADFGGTARFDATGFSIGSKGYIGTGIDGSSRTKDFWEYDPASNAWTQKADFSSTARNGVTGFSIGSKGYIGTGFDVTGNYKKDFWEYDLGYSYTWQPGGQTTASITVSTAGNYTVTTTNAVGCSTTSATTVVTINTPATPIITASGPTSLCPGGSVTLSAPTSNAWTQKADFGGTVRSAATGFSIGSKCYIGTGTDGSNGPKKDFWEYDPASGAWTQKADFGGTARHSATGFSIGSKGYMGTGYDDFSNRKDFWEYDPISNIWAQKADFGGTARYEATGFSIGSKGYIGTGYDRSNKSDFWEYDPTSNAWTQKADFGGVARSSATGFSIGSKGYIGTGEDGNSSRKKDFWEYDPTSNAWTQKADFGGTARDGATGFSIGSKGYIGTGSDGSTSYKKDFWEYDPTSNTWTQKADFGGTARRRATGFNIGSKGYIGTGYDGSSSKKDFWEYDPGYSYVWQPGGQTTASITVSTAGNYTVTTTNASGCSVTSAPRVVTVNAPPATPTVTVVQPTCSVATGTITVNTPNGGGITYSINGSTYQSGNTFDNVAPGSYNVTAKNSDGCVSAATPVVISATSNTITSGAGANGSITPNGLTSVNCGASQTYTIIPDTCYQIATVLVDGVNNLAAVSSGTYTFTNVTAAHTISATFSLRTYTITSGAGVNGSITPNGTTGVNCGASQTFTITPDACYRISDVTVDGNSVGAVTTFNLNNVSANHTIVATFATTPPTGPLAAGTYSIPAACGFLSVNEAANYINTNGLAGPVIFNVAAGYTETAPAGGIIFGQCGLPAAIKSSAARTVVFQKSGAGANPLISAPRGTGILDGIVKTVGFDYLTFDAIDLQDVPSNITTDFPYADLMEWGYALLKCDGNDGSNYVTIKNCNITLNSTNRYGSIGIYSNNHTPTSSTPLTYTGGANDVLAIDASRNGHNAFYSDTLREVNTAIFLKGNGAVSGLLSLKDTLNQVGIPGYGNYMPKTLNIPRTLTAITPSPTTVIDISNQQNAKVIDNYISEGAWARFDFTAMNLNSVDGTIRNNRVDCVNSLNKGSFKGIVANGFTTVTGNEVNMQAIATDINADHTAYSCAMASSTGSPLLFSSNTIPFGMLNQNQTLSGMIVSFPAGSTGEVSYNIIKDLRVFQGIDDNSNLISVSAGTGSAVSVRHNTINNLVNIGAGGLTMLAVSGYHLMVDSNSITKNYFNNSGDKTTITGISINAESSYKCRGNDVSNDSVQTRGTSGSYATINGILISGNCTSETISGNTIRDVQALVGGYDGNVTGISVSTNSSSVREIKNNVISRLSSGHQGGIITGLNNGAGGTVTISNNTVDSLYGVWPRSVTGIVNSGGTSTTYANNFIGPISTNTFRVDGTEVRGFHYAGGSAVKFYNNTIYLSPGNTGKDFNTSGIDVSVSSPLDMRNNIIVNLATTGWASGNVVAYRRSAPGFGGYAATSDNNIFYAGIPSPTHLIYYDGTNSAQLLADYQELNGASDQHSKTENVPFRSTVSGTPGFLHIDPVIPSYAENGGINNTGINVDYDNDIRQGNPGYTGAGSAPDIGADEFNGTPGDITAPVISYTPLGNTAYTGLCSLSATITDASGIAEAAGNRPRLYFKKTTDANTFAGNTSANNGWKYVETSNTSSPFNFTADMSLLRGSLQHNDVIQYFVVAQDAASTPNVGISSGSFAAQPHRVALKATVFPIGGIVNSFTVIAPAVSVIQPTCSVATGTIMVNTPNGSGITYSINGSTYQSGNIFSNLAPGSYNVTVKSNNGCTSIALPVAINVAPAAPATPTVSVTQPTCSVVTGSITVNAPTGTGITYSINGSTYQSGNIFNNVVAGNYNVTAKNSDGCVSAAAAVINATPIDNQPPSIPSQFTVFLNASGQASLTPASVAPLITDNCAVNPNSITVSANNFTCANVNTSGPHQAYVANTSTGNQPFRGEIGMDFTVNNPNGIQINQLGAFDHQSNGITGTQSGGVRVAIFNKATQAIVPGLNVIISGSTDPLVTNYRMRNIPPVTLMPGNYVIVAKGYNAAELNGNVSFGGGPFALGDNGSGAITYTNRISWGNDNPAASFSYPPFSTTASTNEYLAGSFNYAIGSTTNMVTIGASDMAGNSSSVNTIVTVADTFYNIVTRNITVNLDASGHATIQPSDILLSLKNNCGATIISSTLQVTPSSFDCSNVNGAAAIDHQAYTSNIATGNQAYLGEIGMDFTVNNANGIQVNQLGAFDHQANGITGTQSGGVRVAIFNKATQTIVSGLDIVIVGSADGLLSNHRMKNITPVTLLPGNYVIVVKGYNNTELNGNAGISGGPFAAGDNAAGAITYTNRISWGANNSFPSFSYPANAQAGSTNEYHAGTFSYTTTPVPGTRVVLKATDVYGNVDSMSAMVTVEDPNHSCSAPVIAGKISPAQPAEALNEASKLRVYPNPSNGAFNVVLSHFNGAKMSIEITDGNGKLVAVKTLTLSSKIPMLTIPFDLGSNALGMYWIKAVSATGVRTAKLLIQR